MRIQIFKNKLMQFLFLIVFYPHRKINSLSFNAIVDGYFEYVENPFMIPECASLIDHNYNEQNLKRTLD